MRLHSVLLIAAMFVMPIPAGAQQPTTPKQPSTQKRAMFTPEQAAFLQRCNPEAKRDVGKACVCMASGIESVMPLKEYMAMEDAAAQGKLSKEESEKTLAKLEKAFTRFQQCMY